MSMQDPIADMLTRIRNGSMVNKTQVTMPSSKSKCAIAGVLKQEGYIVDFDIISDEPAKPLLTVYLKYFRGQAVINTIKRMSSPSRRMYVGTDKLPRPMRGLGTAVISTSKGMMTSLSAKAAGLGGEVICIVT